MSKPEKTTASPAPTVSWAGGLLTGLSGRLTLAFTALVMTFVIATVATNVIGHNADQRERALLNANHLIVLAKEVSIPHILANQPAELEVFFEELEKRTDVESALLVDPSGALLMAGQSIDVPFLSQVDDPRIQTVLGTGERLVEFGDQLLTIVGPIEVAGELIGVARLELCLKAFSASSKVVWTSNLLLGVLFLGFGFIASRLLAKKLAAPLEELAAAAGKVAQGDLDQHIELRSTDEFAQVGSAFNSMLDNLKTSMDEIHRVAYIDKLTAIPNRSWLNNQLEQLALRHAHSEASFAVMFLDLDKFKDVNDTYGHHIGDLLLRAFSRRLARCLKEAGLTVRGINADDKRAACVTKTEAILGRLGGDEFTIIIPAARAEEVAQRITQAMESPFRLEGCQLQSASSMGIALFPLHAVTREHLLKCADVAMYQAKNNSTIRYAYYNHETHTKLIERSALERDISQAVANKDFEMHLQPQFNVQSGKIVGAEALIRWNHHERGIVSPSLFLPLAATNGHLPEIGSMMLTRAIQAAAQINKGRTDRLTIAVNVGVEELNEETFADTIMALLDQYGADPSDLEIEITEGTAMEESKIVEKQVARLHANGVRFAIDDFGMGYSNLGRLKALAFQTIKVDRSLMTGLGEDPASESLLTTILDMANAIGADVVAEGVETDGQLAFLKTTGCHYYQGYFGGKPMASDDFIQWLATDNQNEEQPLQLAS
ncbi:MAG: putative bifunctional diguanylate cyclase/phosphodiesterase [Devosiaceae bacterium]